MRAKQFQLLGSNLEKIVRAATPVPRLVEIRDPAADLDIEKKEELSAVDKISDDADETPIEPTSPVLEEERNVSVPSIQKTSLPSRQICSATKK